VTWLTFTLCGLGLIWTAHLFVNLLPEAARDLVDVMGRRLAK
jgi:hypothetical protein